MKQLVLTLKQLNLALYCIVLYCLGVLHCIVLYCLGVLHCIVLSCLGVLLYCIILAAGQGVLFVLPEKSKQRRAERTIESVDTDSRDTIIGDPQESLR